MGIIVYVVQKCEKLQSVEKGIKMESFKDRKG